MASSSNRGQKRCQGTTFLLSMEDTDPTTRHPIQEDLKPLQYRSEILKSHNLVGVAMYQTCILL